MKKITRIAFIFMVLFLAILIKPINKNFALSYYDIYKFEDEKFFDNEDVKIGDRISYPVGNYRSDFISYVLPYRGIWCMNDKASTSKDVPYRLRDIIDIEGDTLKSKAYEKTIDGQNYKDKIIKFAWALAFEGKTPGRDYSANTERLWSELYYNVLEPNFGKNIYGGLMKPRGKYTGNLYSGKHYPNNVEMSFEDYRNELENIRLSAKGEGKLNKGEFNYSGDTWNYEIIGQTLDFNSPDNKLVNGQYISFEAEIDGKVEKAVYKVEKDKENGLFYFINNDGSKIGRIVKSDSSIYVSERNNKNEQTYAAFILDKVRSSNKAVKISIYETYVYLRSRLYVICGDDMQSRGICRGQYSDKKISAEFNATPIEVAKDNKIDVSMQKYIEKYKKSDNSEVNAENPKRENKYAYNNSIKDIANTPDGKNTKSVDNENFFKSKEPVKIKQGNKVTYIVSVYNNSVRNEYDDKGNVVSTNPYACGEVLIKDTFDGIEAKENSKIKLVSISELFEENEGGTKPAQLEYGNKRTDVEFRENEDVNEEGQSLKYYYYENDSKLYYFWYTSFKNEQKQWKAFRVTIEYSVDSNEEVEGKIYRNHAEIYKNNNKTKFRTEDDDFVKLGDETDVIVKKYITKVGDTNIESYKVPELDQNTKEPEINANDELSLIRNAYKELDKNHPEEFSVNGASVTYNSETESWIVTFYKTNNSYIVKKSSGDIQDNSVGIDLPSKYDFNNDGKTDGTDVYLLRNYIAEKFDIPEMTEAVKSRIHDNGDVNGDGNINATDTLVLLEIIRLKIDVMNYDFNGDGKLSEVDYDALRRYTKNDPTLSSEIKNRISQYGDLNFDGKINSEDVEELKNLENIKYNFNFDGKINGKDVGILQNWVAENRGDLTDEQKSKIEANGDINGDGEISTSDVTKLNIIALKHRKYKYFDFNNDGIIDETDCELLRKYVKKEDVPEEIENRIIDNGDVSCDGYTNSDDVTELRTFIADNEQYIHGGSSEQQISYITYNNRKDNNNIEKYNSPVVIEKGDYVTYTVEIKNESSDEAEMTVTDIIKFDYDSLECSEWEYSDKEKKGSLSKLSLDETDKKLKSQGKLPGEVTAICTVKVRVMKNPERDQILDNEVIVDVGHETFYDHDYVEERIYKVSLEKYVKYVTDKDGQNKVNTQGRAYKRFNDEAKNRWIVTFSSTDDVYGVSKNGNVININRLSVMDIDRSIPQEQQEQKSEEIQKILNREENYIREAFSKETIASTISSMENEIIATITDNINTYKPNHVVEVEPGDLVTYTIKLKNEGNTLIKIKELKDNPDARLVYKGVISDSNGNKIGSYNNNIITLDNPIVLNAGEYKEIYVTFQAKISLQQTKTSQILKNIAKVEKIENKNDVQVDDSDGPDNNRDQDVIKTKTYAVSLEKFVYKVNGYDLCDFNNDGLVDITDRDILKNYISGIKIKENEKNKIKLYGDVNGDGNINISDTDALSDIINNIEKYAREGYAEHKYDEDLNTNNLWKHNNVVTVSQGNKVTYKIKLKNDGQTNVYINEVTDFLPDGINYDNVTYNGGKYDTTTSNAVTFSGTRINGNNVIKPGEKVTFDVTVTVTESNMSLHILKNTATISKMKNRNEVDVNDTTPNDNTDSDYIQLNYLEDSAILAGKVWVDTARNKTSDYYNGIFDEVESNKEGIEVSLYRNDVSKPIAVKTTDSNGYYKFSDSDILPGVVTKKEERFIKGPKVSGIANRWVGQYYKYYIVFKYDGITYTSTIYGDITAENYKVNSNAKEDNASGKSELTSRTSFNNKFKIIKQDGAYNGNNEKTTNIVYDRYIGKTSDGKLIVPQSIHRYDVNTMSMQSSTNLIDLSKGFVNNQETVYLDQIKYINLGLRGRNSFDLRLKSVVNSIDVTINGVKQQYAGNNIDSATIRMSDIVRDAANVTGEVIDKNGDQEQKVRDTDKSYIDEITVTYKIDVANESESNGYATKIVDYYDNQWLTLDGNSFNSIKSITINAERDSQTKLITYKLTKKAIDKLVNNGEVKVYHMAEISEYTTYANNNEATRGLIDIDSAPGSVNIEKVITTDDYNGINNGTKTKINKTSGITTLQYYFNGNELNKIMYEDDTRPKVAKFGTTSPDNKRVLTGYVFEDYTEVDSSTKVKSGNGMYKDSKDKPVYGANVILTIPGAKNTYTATSGKDGSYRIEGFIPGKGASLTYKYGDTEKTIIIGKENTRSYNGEDFQSTNNVELSKKDNYWYIVNENRGKNAISIASENATTRNKVLTNVAESEELMQLLNKVRAGQSISEAELDTIKSKTNMDATTAKTFTLEVEKANENGARITNGVEEYVVERMNFGIAEVPVTTVDLRSSVKELEIIDAAGDNTIAKASRKLNAQGQWTGEWNITGNVLAPTVTDTKGLVSMLDVSIEEEKLQGAKLKITYEVNAKQNIEKDFKAGGEIKATIKGLVDYVDNDLSYSAESTIGNKKNSDYWEVTTYKDTQNVFKASIKSRTGKDADNSKKYGTVDPEGTNYTTILKAKSNNPLIASNAENVSCDLVLEKVLSAHDNTLENIVSSTVETYDYDNKVEITDLNYEYTTQIGDNKNIDRVRTPKLEKDDTNYVTESWMTILPGINHYASATSEAAAIHPPTGDSIEHNNTVFYIIATASLTVLAVGVVLIKKFAIKKD